MKRISPSWVRIFWRSHGLEKACGAIERMECIVPSKNDEPGRHFLYKVGTSMGMYALRVQNPVAVKVRKTFLKDEARLIRFFSKYGCAPELILFTEKPMPTLVREWTNGELLSALIRSPRLVRAEHIKELIALIIRFENIPVAAYKRACGIHPSRSHGQSRGKAELFGTFIEKIIERFQEADADTFLSSWRMRAKATLMQSMRIFEHLLARVSNVDVLRECVSLSVTFENTVLTENGYRNIDWEPNGFGITHPVFPLVVMLRRLDLKGQKKDFAIREFARFSKIPHARALIEFYNFERAVREFLWWFSWFAKLKHAKIRDAKHIAAWKQSMAQDYEELSDLVAQYTKQLKLNA